MKKNSPSYNFYFLEDVDIEKVLVSNKNFFREKKL